MSNQMHRVPDKGRLLVSGGVVLFSLNILSGCVSPSPSIPTSGLPEVKTPGAFPTLLPSMTVPTETSTAEAVSEYRLGAGDVVEISLYRSDAQENDLTRQLTVRPDGKISYFFIGDVKASGLTPEELRVEVTKRLSRYIRSPDVAVIVVEAAKKRVYVVGEVGQQGVLELKAAREDSLLDAIFLSRGLTKHADADRAYVIRRNAIIPVELGELLFRGDHSKNVVLQSEDVVYVPEVLEQQIFVLGHVSRPGAFEISRPIRISEAIALAGDFSLGAKRNSVKIIRGGLPRGADPPEIVTVDENAIRSGEEIYVQRGDIVFAPATVLGKWNEILTQLLPSLQSIFSASVVARELGR